MNAADKHLLSTYERTSGGITGYAVGMKNCEGEEIIIVASSKDTVARSAEFAGLGEVNFDRIQHVVVLPLYSMMDEVKGD